MNSIDLSHFYGYYPITHWKYKFALLKSGFSNYDSVKEKFQNELFDMREEDYINMLKAEIHFTYFQIIETLFELIFALEKRDDRNLWYYLSIPNWRRNYKRIQSIANGNVGFFYENVDIGESNTIPFLRYILFYLLEPSISKLELENNLETFKRGIIIFAQDFSERDDYNAYKHSLRLYQASINLTFLPHGNYLPNFTMSSKNTFRYLGKDNDNRLLSIVKSFDPDRDLRMADFCYKLIWNIINIRKCYFYNVEHVKIFYFHEIDLNSLNSTDFDLVKFTTPINWERKRNG